MSKFRRPVGSSSARLRRAWLESLEQRTLLSAAISVTDITSEAPSHSVTVAYSDPDGVNTATIDGGDLTVSGPKPVSVSLTNFSGSGTNVTATYSLAGPGGAWDAGDNGAYTITIDPDDVRDSAGNNMDSGATATFDVNVAPAADTTPPTADIAVADVTTGGAGTATVSITYADASGIDAGTIDVGDVTVIRGGAGSGGQQLDVTNVSVSGSGNSRTAVYTFRPPGGTWDAADNGDYTVSLAAGAVQDASANANAV